MQYVFDLRAFEAGRFVAMRFPDSDTRVSGDWVCRADSDDDAIRQARLAAEQEWRTPETRERSAFSVEFVNSTGLMRRERYPTRIGTKPIKG